MLTPVEIINGQYNIAHICTRQQCMSGKGKKTAFRWIDTSGNKDDISFERLDEESNRMANMLCDIGIQKGDIVFTFLPKMPEQFYAFLGILKIQAVAGTLFSNFGEDALVDRLGDSGACAVITRKSLLKKVLRAKAKLQKLTYILVTDIPEDQSADILSIPRMLQSASKFFEAEITSPETLSVLHYTSGSTGKPKGVLHHHKSVLLQSLTMTSVFQPVEEDIFWCTADQGWVTGTSYGIIGPWSIGLTQIHFGGGYDAEKWMRLLAEEHITIWYTAPTALRMLMREEESLFASHPLASLKNIFSVGEPLNPEIIHWAEKIFGKKLYDTWFQTETGSIMICNRPGIEIRPGSMGKPIGPVTAQIISESGDLITGNTTGNLCLQAGWDSMFVQYFNNAEVYQNKFKNGYYYSGDLAFSDADGYFWFVGRNDDVINTGGHLISPFEVESALLEIPEVAESAVIGVPDELLWETIVAYVRLKDGFVWNDDIEISIRLYLSNKLSSVATPRALIPINEIPKNKSGKIMRRYLKALYLGEDPGDISTMDL
jgi:acetyl-CoA synthetase